MHSLRFLPALFAVSILGAAARADDAAINEYVTSAFRHDQRVIANDITVTTHDGVVTLTGRVPTLASSWFAVREAQKIDGVVGVHSELKIDAEQRDDVDITNDVQRRIEHNATIVSKGLTVGCLDGYVTLSGEVATYAEEVEAELIAGEVRGVKQVQNHLLTTFFRNHTDAEVKADVVATLNRDVFLARMPITVTVDVSAVTLSGTVGSAYAKRRAEDEVHKLDNVKAVNNELTIDPKLGHGIRQDPVWPTEEELQAALDSEFGHDGRIDATNITAIVEYGHVELAGKVRTFREKQLAEQDARDIIGVHSVANKLEVEMAPLDDKDLRADLAHALTSDAMLHSFDISTSAKSGAVTLSGRVDTLYERAHAEDLAGRVRGVMTIDNRIDVPYGKKYDDSTLAIEIMTRLKQNKETRSCELVHVEVVNGVAVLTGAVDSWAAHQSVAHVAFHTDGIWKVENRLVVEGFDYPWEEFHQDYRKEFDSADPEIYQFLFI